MCIQRTLDLAYFPHYWEQKYFFQNIQLCHNKLVPNTMLSSRKKTKEPIPRKLPGRRTDLILRTLLAMAGGPMREQVN